VGQRKDPKKKKKKPSQKSLFCEKGEEKGGRNPKLVFNGPIKRAMNPLIKGFFKREKKKVAQPAFKKTAAGGEGKTQSKRGKREKKTKKKGGKKKGTMDFRIAVLCHTQRPKQKRKGKQNTGSPVRVRAQGNVSKHIGERSRESKEKARGEKEELRHITP